MKTIFNDHPEFYFINSAEHPAIITSAGKIANLGEVMRLMDACKYHMSQFESDEEIDGENDEILEKKELERNRWRESKQANKTKTPWQDNLSQVYLMLNKKTGRVKIGISDNPTFREKTLQEEVPDIELIHKGAGSWNDEQKLHLHFAAKRLRGEWFELTTEEIEEAKSLISGINEKISTAYAK